MTKYTHNLKIILVDENHEMIENSSLMELIYGEIADTIIHQKGKMGNYEFDIHFRWERIRLTPIQTQFMGSLFTTSLYSDHVLNQATQTCLKEIEKDLQATTHETWKLLFYISKLLDTETPLTLTIT